MTMAMLRAGGLDTHGEPPAFEPGDIGVGNDIRDILPKTLGMATKHLEPQLSIWPEVLPAKVILLRRNPYEQARSQVKFLKTCFSSLPTGNREIRRIREGITRDSETVLQLFKAMRAAVMIVQFEQILAEPLHTSTDIASFLQLPLDAEKMAAVVLKRGPQCTPDLSIELAACAREGVVS
jgi:hypothetical protein